MTPLPAWRDRPLADLLAEHRLAGLEEVDFPTDGWSGATFTVVDRGDRRFILKRTSHAQDWIARATLDEALREPWLAATLGRSDDGHPPVELGDQPPHAYLGAGVDDAGQAAVLLPDLSAELIAWDRPGVAPGVDQVTLERVLVGLARLHTSRWADALDARAAEAGTVVPWSPWVERLTLLSRPRAVRFEAEGNRVGPIFLGGWAAFEERAPQAAVDLLHRLWADPGPLFARLAGLPSVGLHADLKLANVALLADDRLAFIDWQMAMRAPVAAELAWFLVANSSELPLPPPPILGLYRAAVDATASTGDAGGPAGLTSADDVLGDWPTQVDLAMILGLTLRGWRKGLDAAAGTTLPSGVSAEDDLRWWARQAADAAARRL
jgi:Phosphotransferase enzyme family